METLVTIANLGGFGALAVLMTYAASRLWSAWRKGELVSRPVYDQAIADSKAKDALITALTDALKANTSQLETVGKAVAAVADRMTTTDGLIDNLDRDVDDLRRLILSDGMTTAARREPARPRTTTPQRAAPRAPRTRE